MKKRLVIEFTFDEDDDFDELELDEIKLHDSSNLKEKEREILAESWAQSDYYSVGITSAILDVLTEERIKAKDIRSY